jgi:hypothetical protein
MLLMQLLAVLVIGALGGSIECLLRFDSRVFAASELGVQMSHAGIFGASASLIGGVVLALAGRIGRKDVFDLKSIFSIATLFLCGFSWNPILNGVPTYVRQILVGRYAAKTEQELKAGLEPVATLDAAGALIESAGALPSPVRRQELVALAENAAVEQAKSPSIDLATVEAFAQFTSKASQAGQVDVAVNVAEAIAQSRDANAHEQPVQLQIRERTLEAIIRETPQERRAEVVPRIDAARARMRVLQIDPTRIEGFSP